jgi:replicative DNA helicase
LSDLNRTDNLPAPLAQDPHAVRAAERALLGALMVEPDLFERVYETVRIADFSTQRDRLIYEAMRDLSAGGVPPDFVSLSCELDQRGELTRIGTAYLAVLACHAPAGAYALSYARFVAEYGRQRHGEGGRVNPEQGAVRVRTRR